MNSGSYTVKTLWSGFSVQFVRDAVLEAPIIRNHIFFDGMNWMGRAFNVDISGGSTPAAYDLSQNHPNPFNPSTTFSFDMKVKSRVTLKIYSVTGALVRTLVDEVKPAGSYKVTWDGTGERGSKVASGVYFYRMDTKEFTSTKKMVLLR
jgi:flagellar hook assembly protein FlgD